MVSARDLLLPEPAAPRQVLYLSVGSEFEAGGHGSVQGLGPTLTLV